MSRRAMLIRLDQLPEARSLLPFLLQFHGQRSVYLVFNEAENRMRDLPREREESKETLSC
eukprot:9726208-Karenia_brevis.AAC.1